MAAVTRTADLAVARSLLSRFPVSSKVENTIGIVLAGGMGSRMGLLTRATPKPLLPVLNAPLLCWSLALMRAADIRNVAINIHYLAPAFDTIPAVVAETGIRLQLKPEKRLSGPFGGVLACCAGESGDGDLLVLAGDGLYRFDPAEMLRVHRERRADLTIGISGTAQGSRYGVLDLAADGFVCGMREKPPGVRTTQTASCGVYVVSRELIVRMMHTPAPIDWIDVVQILLSQSRRIAAVNVEEWADVSTADDLLKTNRDALRGPLLPFVAEEDARYPGGNVWRQGTVRDLGATAIEGPVLVGQDVTLGREARISSSIIGPSSRIGHRATVQRSLVLGGSFIPDDAIVIDQVVGPPSS